MSLSVLPGGLRVVTEEMPGVRSASVGVWVGVGSLDESTRLAGASHYLEHLLFKGTRARSASEIAFAIDGIGGEINAFTSHEYTCYYAHVLADHADVAIDVVCDVVLHARISSADVELERSVILDEIAMRDDDPEDNLNDVFAAQVFAGHPIGDPVIGTDESIGRLTRTQIHGYYRRRYQPQAMVVAVAGGVRHQDVVRSVRRAFAERLGDGRAPHPPRRGPAFADPGPGLAFGSRDSEQAHLCAGVPALPREHPDRPALVVLSTALGGGMSSRLFQRIREDRGLTYSCYAATSAYASAGSLSVYAGCHPDNLGIVAELIHAELDDIVAHGLTTDEIARAQEQLCGSMVLGLETSDARMSRIGRRALVRRRYVSVEEEIAAFRAVTAEQLGAVARRLLDRPYSVAVVGPYERRADLPAAVHAMARPGRRGSRPVR